MSPDDVTGMLETVAAGDRRAADVLLPVVYDELRALAESRLRRERAGHTLQPTALVHEAYLKLVDQQRVSWQGRTHFYAVAAQAMGRILVDHARGKLRQKRGGAWHRVSLDGASIAEAGLEIELHALHEALDDMRQLDERQARIVEMRIFGEMTNEQIAEVLGVSPRTVMRDWKMGLAWLRRALSTGA